VDAIACTMGSRFVHVLPRPSNAPNDSAHLLLPFFPSEVSRCTTTANPFLLSFLAQFSAYDATLYNGSLVSFLLVAVNSTFFALFSLSSSSSHDRHALSLRTFRPPPRE
jgi:hypothetical protein